MLDKHQREINYLRLSVTRRYNLDWLSCAASVIRKQKNTAEVTLKTFGGNVWRQVLFELFQQIIRRDQRDGSFFKQKLLITGNDIINPRPLGASHNKRVLKVIHR